MAAELLVYDECEPCPYLDGQIARLPLRLPLGKLTPQELDTALAAGDRRSGPFLYRPRCPQCRACEPLRIDVERFQPSRTQRRILRRGDERLELRIDRPEVDTARVALFNRHKTLRGMDRQGDIDAQGYRQFLVESCCETLELSYRLDGQLVAVAISDRGASSLSAVYCYFDPQFSKLSPGAYSILKQIELCRTWSLRYLYLGLYVADCVHMRYKAGYEPHERLLDGRWQAFNARSGSP